MMHMLDDDETLSNKSLTSDQKFEIVEKRLKAKEELRKALRDKLIKYRNKSVQISHHHHHPHGFSHTVKPIRKPTLHNFV